MPTKRPPLTHADKARTAQRSAASPSTGSAGTASAGRDSPRQRQQGRQIAQLQGAAPGPAPSAGGLPAGLRSGIESLSGMDMSGVRVHRNSARPAALQAKAFAQGQDIHLGPGEEKHLPHEAWHVVQQAQGRVKANAQAMTQMTGRTAVNEDRHLEREADVMGARALQRAQSLDGAGALVAAPWSAPANSASSPVQRKLEIKEPYLLLTDSKQFSQLNALGFKGGTHGKFAPRIKELIDDPADPPHTFDTLQQLLWIMANPPPPKESTYVPVSPYVIKASRNEPDAGVMHLYRAMSGGEYQELLSRGDFSMRLNSEKAEAGIKFFATDINYSKGLSARKNNEAYAKHTKEEDLPYIAMIETWVWAPDVFHGLRDDIGIHKDQGHTKGRLGQEWDRSALTPVLETNGQEWLSTVVTAQGPQDDTDSHGYVIKHESGGFNFGVKAKTEENTEREGATQSPITYFNELVGGIKQIGIFRMEPT